MLGNQREPDDNSFFGKLDGFGNSFGRRHGTGSGMGAFSQQGGMGNLFGERSSHGIMDGFDSLNDGMNEKLDDAARTFHMTDEVEDDDYDFRPDVNYRRGSTYNVLDLDLTRPAAPRNPPRPQFETSTKEVLRKADFRNVRFLANFITEAGIIIKRNQIMLSQIVVNNAILLFRAECIFSYEGVSEFKQQLPFNALFFKCYSYSLITSRNGTLTKISAKAQRKVAREIKTARVLGLMPFTTMGKRPFIFGRSAEEDASEEEYGYEFVQKDAGPEDTVGDAVPDLETA
ncbi:unnamed protein product [Triticum turgidum subsp. durum]|uniref:Small ribosomal subunit protein bS18c n=1 Tax=Triticum turgidum subsp. durum TaxID=4567 RepID=A0A9R0QWG5_TRITD|nr:unnamed protein product [Triticum turgidum subsp. durum]